MTAPRISRPAACLAGLACAILLSGTPAGTPADAAEAEDAGAPDGFFHGFGSAVDWSLKGRLSTSVRGNSNHLLRAGDSVPLLTTRLDAGLTLGAETKRGAYSMDVGLSGPFYLGEEPPDTELPVDPRFAASGLYRGKRYTLTGDFSFDIQPTTYTQFEDTGILSDRTTQLTVDYAAGFTFEADHRNSLSLSTSGGVIEFLSGAPGLVPTRTFTLGAGWNHTVDARTSVGLDLSFQHFASENTLATRSQTLGVNANLSQQRTRRHNIGLGAGVDFVRTEERGRGTDFEIGFSGFASFGYKLKDISVDLNISQSIDPSATGQLQSFSRAGGALTWNVTGSETLSLTADLSRRSPFSGSTAAVGTLNTLSMGANYSLTLTRDANLSLGYLFRARDDSLRGFASGHEVFLTLSHNFTFLP